MTRMLARAAAALVGLGLLGAAARGEAKTSTYGVFCANNRIEISHGDLEQMRIARGRGVCVLGQFGFLSSAQDFARRNFGGEGRPCTCGR
jgi:hypothetical protein